MLLQEIRLKNGFIKILFEDFFHQQRRLRNFRAWSKRNVPEGSACHQFTCVFIVRHTKIFFNEFYIKKTFLESHTDDQLQNLKILSRNNVKSKWRVLFLNLIPSQRLNCLNYILDTPSVCDYTLHKTFGCNSKMFFFTSVRNWNW